MLGGVQYDLAALRYRAGDPGAAVRALDASEQLYAVLARRTPAAAGPLADVRARRAVVRATQGHGASALVDAQAALLGLHAAPGRLGRPDGRDDPGSARVLALCGDVLAAFGDPDLALVASERAVRALLGPAVAPPAVAPPAGAHPTGTFLTDRPGSPHPGYLARACRVAAVIRQARGPGQVDRARRLAAAAAHLGAPPTSTLLEQRISSPLPPDLTLGLRGALRVAERRGGDPGATSSLLQALAAPDTDGAPPGWSTDPTWHGRITAARARPNGPTPAAAGACATMLGRLAGDILSGSADPLVGLRLMLEAHCLRAAPAAAARPAAAAPGGPVDRTQPADPAWAGLLDAASRRIAAVGDPSFALDLASWAERARGGPARRPVAALDPQGAAGTSQALPC
ncbi:hypothetical protein [Parafrankia sp. FMc2]|uniref:hypothetical protein n=1 Tax=Parafrankia sp. FMc2 TaxID=3233196 RepID=UPI0034D49AB9